MTPSKSGIADIQPYEMPNGDIYGLYTFTDGRQEIWYRNEQTRSTKRADCIPKDAVPYTQNHYRNW